MPLRDRLYWRAGAGALLAAMLLAVVVVSLVAGGGQNSASALQASGGPAGVVATETPCVPPANDDYTNRVKIKSIPFTDTVDTSCATEQLFEAQYCKPAGGTVWYQYSPRDDAILTVTGSGEVSVFYWVFYGGWDHCAYSETGSVTLPLSGSVGRQGLTYYIQVSSSDGAVTVDIQHAPTPTPCPDGKVGSLAGCRTPWLTATPCVPPANDDFANAEAVTSQPFTASTSTICATQQDGEPSCEGGYYTIWYAYTAPATEIIQVDTFGSGIDTVLGVYSGSALDSLTRVGCNNDAYPADVSAVRFKGLAGRTYYIQVGGRYERGAVALNIGQIQAPPPPFTPTPTWTPCPTPKVRTYFHECGTVTPTFTPTSTPTPCPAGKVPYYLRCFTPTPTNTPCVAPPNDDVANAVTITSIPFTMSGSAHCATEQPTESVWSCGDEKSVWFRFTATSSEALRASLTGWHTSGNIFASTKPVRCLDAWGGAAEGTFNAVEGVTYYFQITAHQYADGAYTFSLDVAPPPTPTQTPCAPNEGLYYDNEFDDYRCMTPTPTRTPCPDGKVLGYDYSGYPYQPFCGTPTPTFTPCPTEMIFYDYGYSGLVCGTATPTRTPCPSGKEVFNDPLYFPEQRRCGTPTPTPTACPTGSTPAYEKGCVTPTSTRTPCPTGKVLIHDYADYTKRYICGTPSSTPTVTLTPTPCPATKVLFYDYRSYPYEHCGTATPTFTPSPTCPPGKEPTFFGCSTPTPSKTATKTVTPTLTRTPTVTSTPCPAGKVAIHNGCATPTPTLTPCPAGKVVYYDITLYQDACGTPTPTFTPCPVGKVKTFAGCGTPRPRPDPDPGLDFSIGINTDAVPGDDCGTGPGQATNCYLSPGRDFTVRAYLNGLPTTLNFFAEYAAFAAHMIYTGGVVAEGNADAHHWPDCVFEVTASFGTYVNIGCSIGPDRPPSVHTGVVATADFRCMAGGSILLGHEPGETLITDFGLREYREGGPDMLIIDCTGSPPPATPTATPSAGPQGASPGMALSLYGDTAKQDLVCGNGALHRTCALGASSMFSVDVETDAGPPNGFQGYQTVIQYSGAINLVDQGGLAENRWPRCAGPGLEQQSAPSNAAPGRYILGCTTSQAAQTYEGVLANVHFACKGEGTGLISILGGGGARTSFYHKPSINGNRIFLAGDSSAGQLLADAVVVQCDAPGGAIGGFDTDGDGCSDSREQGANERLGGRRDALNPWDFFDPTGDRKHRIDDVLAVVDSYFTSEGSADYQMDADRTLLGPSFWNLGPPNGLVRVDDILASVKQYFHDCG